MVLEIIVSYLCLSPQCRPNHNLQYATIQESKGISCSRLFLVTATCFISYITGKKATFKIPHYSCWQAGSRTGFDPLLQSTMKISCDREREANCVEESLIEDFFSVWSKTESACGLVMDNITICYLTCRAPNNSPVLHYMTP